MAYNPTNPMIVQSDRSVLLEVDSPLYSEARDALARFAELEKSPEYIHTYRLSPLSLWNAASAGLNAADILGALERYSKYPLPDNVRVDIADYVSRYGRLKLVRGEDSLLLQGDDPALIAEVMRHRLAQPYIVQQLDPLTLAVDLLHRGHIKQALLAIGYPAEDLAGYVEGERLAFRCRQTLFHATVTSCARQFLGYFVELRFDAGWRWSRRKVRPKHLFDPAALLPRAAHREPAA